MINPSTGRHDTFLPTGSAVMAADSLANFGLETSRYSTVSHQWLIPPRVSAVADR